jgi:endonuclease/exonuclease/phosphatase family metal-dependent hydrolase
MKKLLLLIAAAVMIITYMDLRYASVPVTLEKKLVYEDVVKDTPDVMPAIKVMTYNIHRGVNRDNKLDLEGIAETIKGLKADIIALQEVERFSVRTRFQDQIGYIAEKLSMSHVFGKSVNILNGEYGNAILSKYPIEEYEVTELTSAGENRTLLRAKINIQGKRTSLYNTHLGLKQNERDIQLQEIMKLVGADKDFILAGDFNTSVDKLSVITEEYIDCAGRGADASKATFEKEGLSERIDYIFTSKGFVTKVYDVPESQASDHYPVVSVIELE